MDNLRLVADVMLGRLARWRRAPGYDTLHFRDAPDGRLRARALADRRRLLPRDAARARRARAAGLLVRGTSLATRREFWTCTGCGRVFSAGTHATGVRRGSSRTSAVRGVDVAGDTRADCGSHAQRKVIPQASSRLRAEASGQNRKMGGTLADDTTWGGLGRAIPAWPRGPRGSARARSVRHRASRRSPREWMMAEGLASEMGGLL